MIGLDTNILLRYLAQDDRTQSPRATEIIERRLTEEEPGFVSLVSILEVVWVLKSLFKLTRQEIANDIEMLLAADTLEVQNEQEVYYAVVSLRTGIGTFEDALIGSLGAWRGCSAICSNGELLWPMVNASGLPIQQLKRYLQLKLAERAAPWSLIFGQSR